MDEMTNFERLIAKAATLEAGPARPVDVRPIVRSAATASAGRRSVNARSAWLHDRLGAPHTGLTLFGAIKFAAAAFIVALFGGFLLAGVLTQPTRDGTLPAAAPASPEVSPTHGFTLPVVLPDDLDSGTIDTPLGPARWVHVRADQRTLPSAPWPAQVMPWADGLALFRPPGGPRPSGRTPWQLWVTTDGIDWREAALPLPAEADYASLTFVEGVWWLMSYDRFGPLRVWSSTDTVDWKPIETHGLESVESDGSGWRDHTAPVTAHGSTYIAVVRHGQPRLIAIDESGGRLLETPFNRSTQMLFSDGDDLFAYGEAWDGANSAPTVWTSSDGREWTEVGSLNDPPGLGLASIRGRLTSVPGALALWDGGLRGPQPWETTNGLDWTPAPGDAPECLADTCTKTSWAITARTGSGWFANDLDHHGEEFGDDLWWHLADTWVSLADMGTATPRGMPIVKSGFDDTTVLLRMKSWPDLGTPTDLWVLNLDPTAGPDNPATEP